MIAGPMFGREFWVATVDEFRAQRADVGELRAATRDSSGHAADGYIVHAPEVTFEHEPVVIDRDRRERVGPDVLV